MGTAKCVMNAGNVPNFPGKTKSKRLHSSFKLFWMGVPVQRGGGGSSEYYIALIRESECSLLKETVCVYGRWNNITKGTKNASIMSLKLPDIIIRCGVVKRFTAKVI